MKKFKKEILFNWTMKKSNLISLIVSGISFILLIVFLSLLLGDQLEVRSCGCPHVIQQNFVWIFIVLGMIFMGGLIYYLLSLKIDKKDRKVKFNVNTIMQFLDEDEKKIIKQLSGAEGKMLQSDIKDLSKLKKHRAIKKLRDKNIVKVEKSGNKNKVKLNENFELEDKDD